MGERIQELPWRREAPTYPYSAPQPPVPPPPLWDVTHIQIYNLIKDSFETIWGEVQEIKRSIQSSSTMGK